MVNEKQLTSDIKLFSDQINKIKETMGLSKKAREEAQADGNFSAWLSDLKARAKLFGVHRENQPDHGLMLMQEQVHHRGQLLRPLSPRPWPWSTSEGDAESESAC